MPRAVFILATLADSRLGASVYGTKEEALDAAAAWARAHFEYDGEANLSDIRAHLDAVFVSGECGEITLDIVEDFLCI
jgi:hypothetical protein